MKSHTHYLKIKTKNRKEIVNITREIERIVYESGVKEGLCLINPMHITASVFINDEEPGLKQDFMHWLEFLAPDKSDYLHHHTGEDNADAHLKRTIMGRETTVAITDNRLDLGTWEQIFYGEFDGQREKRILVKIIGE
mgnify:CR=1 FL=1